MNVWVEGGRQAGRDGQMIEPSAFMGGGGPSDITETSLTPSITKNPCCPSRFTVPVIYLSNEDLLNKEETGLAEDHLG